MNLKSKAFENNRVIPSDFTCDGRDVSPQLSWEDVPTADTKSFALSVTDPDAPGGMWIHWLVYNISKEVRTIEHGGLPKGAKEVKNDFGMEKYGGPCPPSGTHRYIFTIYALSLEKLEDINKNNFFDKVKENAIDKAELVGLYKKL